MCWSEKPENTVGRMKQEHRLVTKSMGLRQVQGPRPGSEQCVPLHKLCPICLLISCEKLKNPRVMIGLLLLSTPKMEHRCTAAHGS